MSIEVLRAGTLTTIQDWPGRLGFWHVGVPPSGPMDDRSFRAGNLAVGNPEGAPGLECTLAGPKLRFARPATVCVCGAEAPVLLDGRSAAQWEPLDVPEGAELDVGRMGGRGLRVYILVAGGCLTPPTMGSAATFTLGRLGGQHGRALIKGDVLEVGAAEHPPRGPLPCPSPLTHAWELAVTEGPHAAPDFFTEAGLERFYAATWEVHFNSARTGVRLIGPKPEWARADGGDAGLHPSNIHDTPYAIGAVDFTGDVPVILGPDGPSLGGFVCPATVVRAERWKLGQLRPGDTVRFRLIAEDQAHRPRWARAPARRDHGVLECREPGAGVPGLTARRAGDDHLLVEYGPMVLDLSLRLRVHALAQELERDRPVGLIDITAGIRSLQLHVDPGRLPLRRALELALAADAALPPSSSLAVPSRRVHLPLSWDDPAARLAVERYMSGVRADAPWCPWNIEFIRRINGLESVDDVRQTVFSAEYLVVGLGDVYLGAPVAIPLDPRHRLVTTKYNPARTWTPENAVGIGGAYLCVYGMEGPGGYQLVGRTIPVWRREDQDPPWLLRQFDRICWYPVSADELTRLRADPLAAAAAVRTVDGRFSLSEHERLLSREAGSIAEFTAAQAQALAAERERWAQTGELAAALP